MHQPLIQPKSRINVTSGLNICKMLKKTELKVHQSHFNSFNITSYLIYTDLIISLLDPKLVDSNLIADQVWIIVTSGLKFAK